MADALLLLLLLLRPWLWITAQCTLFGWTFQWASPTSSAASLSSARPLKRRHDKTRHLVALATFVHRAVDSRRAGRLRLLLAEGRDGGRMQVQRR